MGAYSKVIAFDFNRHSQVVVPALREFLDSGTLTGELQILFDTQFQRELTALKPFPDQQASLSEQLLLLKSGLGLNLEHVCQTLDHGLGARTDSIVELAAIRPHLKGGCDSNICEARSICPLNRLHQEKINSYRVMRLTQQWVKTSCRNVPSEFILGRDFQFHNFCWWYGNEMGLAYTQAEHFFMAAQDELALLLARLSKRGAIWGWEDGGSGEGLLGWLSGDECLKLAEGLEAYELSEGAGIPLGLRNEDYLCEHILPQMRTTMAQLRDYSRLCGTQQLGILLERV